MDVASENNAEARAAPSAMWFEAARLPTGWAENVRVTPDDLEAIAAMAFVEMAEGGFTRAGEFHYVHHDGDGTPYANPGELTERICSAAQTAGLHLTLRPSFYAYSGFGGQPPTGGSSPRRTRLPVRSRARTAPRDTFPARNVGIAPHCLRAVTAGELQSLVELCADRPIHLHAAAELCTLECSQR